VVQSTLHASKTGTQAAGKTNAWMLVAAMVMPLLLLLLLLSART
jgi:hypothetical protein